MLDTLTVVLDFQTVTSGAFRLINSDRDDGALLYHEGSFTVDW